MADNENKIINYFEKDKLDEMISYYLDDFDSFWEDEEYKWKAVQHFQNHWDIDSDDFEEMMKESTSKHFNLLGSGNYFPIGVLLDIVKDFHEELRLLFKGLYDENLDLIQRIKDFQKGIDAIYKKTAKPGKNTYQDLRAVSVLLWMRFPDKYYIYKSTELKETFKCLGGNAPKLDGKAECFPVFLDYMNALNAYFLSNDTFKETILSHINSNSLYEDKSLHTATIDFIFYTGKRFDSNRLKQTNTEGMSNETEMSVNDKILKRKKIKEEFKLYLEKAARSSGNKESAANLINLGASAVSSYLLFIEVNKLFDYNPEKWKHIESLYDIVESNAIKSIVDDLLKDEEFKKRDKNNNKNYRSNAIKHYYCFINARELFLKNKKTDDKVQLPTNLPEQIIYYGAPGTGKSFTIKDKYGINKTNSFRTTFHPDSDYSSFVGCYKPTKDSNGITYEFVPQVFTEAYIAAWRGYKERKPIYLIIEEINRGNCAQIFGDLFQLLDRNKKGFSDYETRPEKDLMQFLKDEFAGKHELPALELPDFPSVISGDELLLPPNLNILATMNTSDQSLFPIDSAFKRRWQWRYIAIKNANKGYQIELDDMCYDWWDFVKQVNEKIKDVTSSEDKKMGYFFAKTIENGIIKTDHFVSKVLFYLWSDIFKDYADDVENNIFRKKVEEKGENGEEKYEPLSFTDFFDENGRVNKDVLSSFLEQFELKKSKMPVIQPAISISKKDHLRVTLPSGDVIEEASSKETFVRFIECLGPDKVNETMSINKKKYPVVSKEKFNAGDDTEKGYEKQIKEIEYEGDTYYIQTKFSVSELRSMVEKILLHNYPNDSIKGNIGGYSVEVIYGIED